MDDIDNMGTVVAIVNAGEFDVYVPLMHMEREKDTVPFVVELRSPDRDIEAAICEVMSIARIKEVPSRSWSWVPNKLDRKARR